MQSRRSVFAKLIITLFVFLHNAPLKAAQEQLAAYLAAHGNPNPAAIAEGVWVGNGGDPLYSLFENARDRLKLILKGLGESPDLGNSDFEGFYASYRSDIAAKVKQAEFFWITKPAAVEIAMQGTCALTTVEHPGINPETIWLRLDLCTQLLQGDNFMRVVIETILHEVVHQFRFVEDKHWSALAETEKFAIQFSKAVFDRYLANSAPNANTHSQLHAPAYFEGRQQSAIAGSAITIGEGNYWEAVVYGGCKGESSLFEGICNVYHGDGMLFRFADDPVTMHTEPVEYSEIPVSTAIGTRAGSFMQPVKWKKHNSSHSENYYIMYGGCRSSSATNWGCDEYFNDLNILHSSLSQAPQWIPVEMMAENEVEAQHFNPIRKNPTVTGSNDYLVVFGGTDPQSNKPLSSFSILDLQSIQITGLEANVPSEAWQKITLPESLSGIYSTEMVITGTKLFAWGGCKKSFIGCQAHNQGFILDLETLELEMLPDSNLDPRFDHSIVWTGREFLVWGGRNRSRVFQNGSAYDLYVQGSWESLEENLPPGESGRYFHKAIWNPIRSQMLIFAGANDTSGLADSLLVYSPVASASGSGSWAVETIHDFSGNPISTSGRVEFASQSFHNKLMYFGGRRAGEYLSSGGIISLP